MLNKIYYGSVFMLAYWIYQNADY